MSLEDEIHSICELPGVQSVEFIEGAHRVRVLFDSQEMYFDWPHGDDVGTHDQKEEYLQDQMDVDWDLVEEKNTKRGGMDGRLAIFRR